MLTTRDATGSDGEACAAIYAPYVTGTAISFELEPPAPEVMSARIAAAAAHAWLVLEDTGEVIGYAYGHPFAERAAYRWTCETSIYLARDRRRAGGGRLLYRTLLDRLAARGYRRAMAGMTLPNEASAGLHRALGFEPVGVYRKVGWKHGAWHDVAWVQKTIVPDEAPLVELPA
ncbi:GNAT family N-acetyltransferase [Amycolatopsis alkalitolerans]|uniref:N-acetyltransferase family protein n=1 Tax=Amycolatopsis alkalitolerans TaxID=2547244 RepID=A0A5C4M3Q5_9PSEU|nr:GNAT family N-acetyltransferase [Amycolatopsis alkalitolerans]TNC26513.1 N-acetyltransferase family protein [Amycolatopsis alkalitolerans]